MEEESVEEEKEIEEEYEKEDIIITKQKNTEENKNSKGSFFVEDFSDDDSLEDIHYKTESKKDAKLNKLNAKKKPKIEYEYETENVNTNVMKKKNMLKNIK